ncbi:MAG: MerR family transcriptional regulator [Geodermatophilaceae bacterium]|nr:MerR family transcriptional regulator [Geodermatophilaceae bacterium]
MESATVHTAAQTTGWSVRMLHYLDAAGLVSPPRSPSGYRLYGERQITQLRELRQLLADHDLRPADLQVALRLRSEPTLRHAVDDWLDSTIVGAASVTEDNQTSTPADNEAQLAESDPTTSWLRFEQDKHSRALALTTSYPTPSKETA